MPTGLRSAAIRETFDACLVLGDLVDYGLEPAPCIDWVRQNGTHAVRGNHDHGVAQFVKVHGRNGFKYLTGVTREVTQERIGPDGSPLSSGPARQQARDDRRRQIPAGARHAARSA